MDTVVSYMQPTCDDCGEEIEDGDTWVSVSGGTVHRDEPQGDAGGGMFHPDCACTYIQQNYSE